MSFSKCISFIFREASDLDVLKTVRETLLCGNEAPVQDCYKPKCIRLVPPIHAFDDEVEDDVSLYFY